MGSQFHEDGSNFEASTSYHRLSAEIVIYCTALILGFDEAAMHRLKTYDSKQWPSFPKLKAAPLPLFKIDGKRYKKEAVFSVLPNSFLSKVEKMAEFSIHSTKPNGAVVQIGDNDSGRFFKLTLSYGKTDVRTAKKMFANLVSFVELSDDCSYLIENHLDHRHLVSAINGIFERSDFADFCGKTNHESRLIAHLSRGVVLTSRKERDRRSIVLGYGGELNYEDSSLSQIKDLKQTETTFEFPGDPLTDNLEQIAYPDFGLFILRNKRVFLSVRAGSVGQNGFGGHAHNDQLSVELQVDGEDILVDPGTYVYTASPSLRNRYRSIHAHFSPAIGGLEPVSFSDGLFRLKDTLSAKCIFFRNDVIVCATEGTPEIVLRRVKVHSNRVVITDFFPNEHFITNQSNPVAFSLGYGITKTK